jgi:hypothetical protein
MSRVVGPLIYRHYDFLSTLRRARSTKRRQELIRLATPEQLLSIVEVAHNILELDAKSGKPLFRLSARQRRKLIPSASIIRRIARVRSERSARHHIQKGSGIPALLASLLAPVVVEVGKQLLFKRENGS